MNKVKITADVVLNIVQRIFSAEDINEVIDAPSVPSWDKKTVQEALNVEYYTFKHRPISTEEIIAQKISEGLDTNLLDATNRSFCVLWLSDVERLFSKDADMLTVGATMEYWIQTSKLKLLEDLIEDCNRQKSGLRISVPFGAETRQAVIVFSAPDVVDVQTGTSCGEMSVCNVSISMILYPNAVSYSDYKFSFSFLNNEEELQTVMLPVSSFSFVNTMTQKAVPNVLNSAMVGSINLSCAKAFVIVFEGYDNDFVEYLTDRSLKADSGGVTSDNNELLTMNIKRKKKKYAHDVVIKDHQVIVSADTSNETHTLTLVNRGFNNNGTT